MPCPMEYPSELVLPPMPCWSGNITVRRKYPSHIPPQPQFMWKHPLPSYPSHTHSCPPVRVDVSPFMRTGRPAASSE